MKRLVLAALALALVVPAFAVPALADPSDPVVQVVHQTPSILAVPTVTVYGRPNKPMVQILIRTPSATDAAGAAHGRLRAKTDAKYEPAAP
jgi:hypothetical protein